MKEKNIKRVSQENQEATQYKTILRGPYQMVPSILRGG